MVKLAKHSSICIHGTPRTLHSILLFALTGVKPSRRQMFHFVCFSKLSNYVQCAAGTMLNSQRLCKINTCFLLIKQASGSPTCTLAELPGRLQGTARERTSLCPCLASSSWLQGSWPLPECWPHSGHHCAHLPQGAAATGEEAVRVRLLFLLLLFETF